MNVTVHPGPLTGEVLAPSSKSEAHRALICAAFAPGATDLVCSSTSADIDATISCLEALGARVARTRVGFRVRPVPGSSASDNLPAPNRDATLDCGESGSTLRFMLPVVCALGSGAAFIGHGRLPERPLSPLYERLVEHGAVLSPQGKSPLMAGGRVRAGRYELPGNVSSQYVSGLLLAAPLLRAPMELVVSEPVESRPYIDLTLRLMTDFGGQVRWMPDGRSVRVEAHAYSTRPYTVESDWSAASYWYEMAALSREAQVELPGLLPDSPQGDSAVAQLFGALGVKTDFNGTGAVLGRMPRALERMDYDFTNQPDLAQTFVVTCALLGLPFRFSGLQSLKIKETDRMEALRIELRKLGYAVREEEGSVLAWDGERVQADPCPVIDTYEDHRMAMAFAPAALCLPEIRINHPQVVSKSYPHYWDDLRRAGFHLEEL